MFWGPATGTEYPSLGDMVAGQSYLSYRYLLSPPFGGILPGTFLGRVRGENDAVFAADRPVGGPSLSAIRRALLSDALPSVDVAGVEPALGPLNGHILVGGRTPFAERAVRRVSGSHKPRPSQITKNNQRLPKRFSSSVIACFEAVPQ